MELKRESEELSELEEQHQYQTPDDDFITEDKPLNRLQTRNNFSQEMPEDNSVPQISENHMTVHNRSKPFKCHCGTSFKYLRRLKYHMKIHPHEKKPHLCQFCKKRFKSLRDLRQHVEIHSTGGLFVCQQCGIAFKNRGSLINHMGIHTDEKPYRCQCCRRGFKYKGRLKIHLSEGCPKIRWFCGQTWGRLNICAGYTIYIYSSVRRLLIS